MSVLLFLSFVSISTSAPAVNHVEADTMRTDAVVSPFLAKAKGPYKLKGGNDLYLLAESNMPCVVPRAENYKMPNIGTKNMLTSPQKPGGIPQVRPVHPLRQTSVIHTPPPTGHLKKKGK